MPEVTTVLWSSGDTRVERIVSRGHHSPDGFWYDQTEDEFVVLLDGAARLELEDGTTFALARGDTFVLPAGCRHRVAWTDPACATIWLAVFCRPAAAAPPVDREAVHAGHIEEP